MGKKYKTPPLIEALCEFSFKDSHWDDAVPGLFYEKVKNLYPQRRQVEQNRVRINISADSESITKKSGEPRIQFLSKDKTRIVQIAKDLLVVNHLKPYPQFEEWEPSIEQLLKEYVALANPSGIKRLGVRYINNIVLPKADVNMAEYFRIFPQFPIELGKKHGPFMIRVELPTKHESHKVLVTFGNSNTPGVDAPSYMLDLYDTRNGEMAADCKSIHAEIKKAHENVETIFENSIMDSLRTLFGEVKQ